MKMIILYDSYITPCAQPKAPSLLLFVLVIQCPMRAPLYAHFSPFGPSFVPWHQSRSLTQKQVPARCKTHRSVAGQWTRAPRRVLSSPMDEYYWTMHLYGEGTSFHSDLAFVRQCHIICELSAVRLRQPSTESSIKHILPTICRRFISVRRVRGSTNAWVTQAAMAGHTIRIHNACCSTGENQHPPNQFGAGFHHRPAFRSLSGCRTIFDL